MDSFHTHARVAKRSTYDLIRTSVLQVIRVFKHYNSVEYEELKKDHSVGSMLKRMTENVNDAECNLQFSSLVVNAYGLLVWIEAEEKKGRLTWKNEDINERFRERKELLRRVLRENVQPVQDKSDPGSNSGNSSAGSQKESASVSNESPSPKQEKITYQEIPREKKPTDRLVSAYTPDVRAGRKSKTISFVGDKIQVVESAKSGLVLLADPIPGNEVNGEAWY